MGNRRPRPSYSNRTPGRATVHPVVLGIDEPKVTAWLDEHVEGLTGPYTFELIAGGRSNVTYRGADSGGTKFVLRRPPLGHVLATAHDMAREHRLITDTGALHRCRGERSAVLRDVLR